MQNSDSSTIFYTAYSVNVAPTANIAWAVNGNIRSTTLTVCTTNLSCVNALFDTIGATNMVVDPATPWEVSIVIPL